MRIQVNGDSSVEFHLSKVSGERLGSQNKRCLMKSRAAGRDPVFTKPAASVGTGMAAAAQQIDRLLSSRFGRSEARK